MSSPQAFLRDLDKKLWAEDILGPVYEYFLGQFALAEEKKGGQWSRATWTTLKRRPKGLRGGANQYFTPKSIVSLIVEMIEPYQGRLYDPAMGSGGMFVQSAHFVKNHHRNRIHRNQALRPTCDLLLPKFL
jgi:type I restriction enzyme M protein